MKKLATVTIVSIAAIALSGCSFIEEFLPAEEQPTITVFEEESSDSIFDEPIGHSSPVEEIVVGENPDDADSQSDVSADNTEAAEPAEPVPAATIEELYDTLDDLTALTKNSCLAENTLGAVTFVSVRSEGPPPPYEILHMPDNLAERDAYAVAYYPLSPNNLNPEILSDYTPHVCALAELYPKAFLERIPEDAALTDASPDDISVSYGSNTYIITLGEQTHVLYTAGPLLVRSEIITPELTTTRAITHSVTNSQASLFEALVRVAR